MCHTEPVEVSGQAIAPLRQAQGDNTRFEKIQHIDLNLWFTDLNTFLRLFQNH